MAKKRSVANTLILGFCSAGRHEQIDEKAVRVPGTCPGSIVQTVKSKYWDEHDICHCQCSCHGKDRPPAWSKVVKPDPEDAAEPEDYLGPTGNSSDDDKPATIDSGEGIQPELAVI